MKLFVFDIDGTLIDRNYFLSMNVISAINKLINQGHVVATCSGRCYLGSIKFLSRFDKGNTYCICANGASIYKSDGTKLIEHSLKLKDYFKVYEKTKHIKPFYQYFYKDSRLGHLSYDEAIELDKKSSDIDDFNIDINDDKNMSIEKIMIRDKSRVYAAKYKIPLIFKLKYNAVNSSRVFIEITHKRANKGKGVEYLRKKLGISKNDVYVFGDSGNDIPMIKRFKNSVAMGNANNRVKKHAKYITKDINEDGIVYALENILKVI